MAVLAPVNGSDMSSADSSADPQCNAQLRGGPDPLNIHMQPPLT
jgi:hypothetical protein